MIKEGLGISATKFASVGVLSAGVAVSAVSGITTDTVGSITEYSTGGVNLDSETMYMNVYTPEYDVKGVLKELDRLGEGIHKLLAYNQQRKVVDYMENYKEMSKILGANPLDSEVKQLKDELTREIRGMHIVDEYREIEYEGKSINENIYIRLQEEEYVTAYIEDYIKTGGHPNVDIKNYVTYMNKITYSRDNILTYYKSNTTEYIIIDDEKFRYNDRENTVKIRKLLSKEMGTTPIGTLDDIQTHLDEYVSMYGEYYENRIHASNEKFTGTKKIESIMEGDTENIPVRVNNYLINDTSRGVIEVYNMDKLEIGEVHPNVNVEYTTEKDTYVNTKELKIRGTSLDKLSYGEEGYYGIFGSSGLESVSMPRLIGTINKIEMDGEYIDIDDEYSSYPNHEKSIYVVENMQINDNVKVIRGYGNSLGQSQLLQESLHIPDSVHTISGSFNNVYFAEKGSSITAKGLVYLDTSFNYELGLTKSYRIDNEVFDVGHYGLALNGKKLDSMHIYDEVNISTPKNIERKDIAYEYTEDLRNSYYTNEITKLDMFGIDKVEGLHQKFMEEDEETYFKNTLAVLLLSYYEHTENNTPIGSNYLTTSGPRIEIAEIPKFIKKTDFSDIYTKLTNLKAVAEDSNGIPYLGNRNIIAKKLVEVALHDFESKGLLTDENVNNVLEEILKDIESKGDKYYTSKNNSTWSIKYQTYLELKKDYRALYDEYKDFSATVRDFDTLFGVNSFRVVTVHRNHGHLNTPVKSDIHQIDIVDKDSIQTKLDGIGRLPVNYTGDIKLSNHITDSRYQYHVPFNIMGVLEKHYTYKGSNSGNKWDTYGAGLSVSVDNDTKEFVFTLDKHDAFMTRERRVRVYYEPLDKTLQSSITLSLNGKEERLPISTLVDTTITTPTEVVFNIDVLQDTKNVTHTEDVVKVIVTPDGKEINIEDKVDLDIGAVFGNILYKIDEEDTGKTYGIYLDIGGKVQKTFTNIKPGEQYSYMVRDDLKELGITDSRLKYRAIVYEEDTKQEVSGLITGTWETNELLPKLFDEMRIWYSEDASNSYINYMNEGYLYNVEVEVYYGDELIVSKHALKPYIPHKIKLMDGEDNSKLRYVLYQQGQKLD